MLALKQSSGFQFSYNISLFALVRDECDWQGKKSTLVSSRSTTHSNGSKIKIRKPCFQFLEGFLVSRHSCVDRVRSVWYSLVKRSQNHRNAKVARERTFVCHARLRPSNSALFHRSLNCLDSAFLLIQQFANDSSSIASWKKWHYIWRDPTTFFFEMNNSVMKNLNPDFTLKIWNPAEI